MKHLPFALCLLLLAGTSASQATSSLPNIILCMGDDHGWEETGYYNHPHVKTPVLDEMAATGLRLDRFHAAHPSCSPTRGSFLTGRHPNRYGTFTPGCSIRPQEITIAKLLSEVGYRCGHFGKWHLGPVKAESPTNPRAMGFHEYLSHDNFFELNPSLSRNGGPPEVHPGESSEVIMEAALRFMEASQKSNSPFLAVIWFGSPHEPYSGLPKDLALYDDLPNRYADRKVKLTSNETGLQVQRPLGEVLRERYAEITAMDRSMGMLREFLKKTRLRDNTLLWYCGDNGTPRSGVLASPLRGMKGQVFEGGTRVPGILEWPARLKKPRQSTFVATTSDILPTLCDITGAPLPDRPLDGISLLPLVEDLAPTRRPKPVFFWDYPASREFREHTTPYIDPELQKGTTPLVKLSGGLATRNFKNAVHNGIEPWNYDGKRAMIQGRYKLHVHGETGKEPTILLYDLDSDPGETRDLSGKQTQIVESMMPSLRKWQESVLHSLTHPDE